MLIDSTTINLIFTTLSLESSYWIMSENISIAVSNPSLYEMPISVELVHNARFTDVNL